MCILPQMACSMDISSGRARAMPHCRAHHSNHKRHCCCLLLPLPLLGLQCAAQCIQQPTGCKAVDQAGAWGPPIGSE